MKIRISTFNSLKELTRTVLIRRPLLRSEKWSVQGSLVEAAFTAVTCHQRHTGHTGV